MENTDYAFKNLDSKNSEAKLEASEGVYDPFVLIEETFYPDAAKLQEAETRYQEYLESLRRAGMKDVSNELQKIAFILSSDKHQEAFFSKVVDEEGGKRLAESKAGDNNEKESSGLDVDNKECSPNKINKRDFDEDVRHPQYVPKKGFFYMHDDRNRSSQNEPPRNRKKVWMAEKKWSHDLFCEEEQLPKSRNELIEAYGYDIRIEEGPPQAGRWRRYGRGPMKYGSPPCVTPRGMQPIGRFNEGPRGQVPIGRNLFDEPNQQNAGHAKKIFVNNEVTIAVNYGEGLPPFTINSSKEFPSLLTKESPPMPQEIKGKDKNLRQVLPRFIENKAVDLEQCPVEFCSVIAEFAPQIEACVGDKYSEKRGIPLGDLTFEVDGEKLDASESPEGLDRESGSCIDVKVAETAPTM